MMMNGFERQVVNRLQMQMSKREAENALYEIREALGEDCYDQIRPQNIVGANGKITREYPPIKKIIWAYFNDRFDVFENA